MYTEPDTDTDSDITLFAVWFTSKNSFTGVLLKDISNPEEAVYREEVEIKGKSGKYVEISKRHDYTGDKCRCPNCGGLGFPWNGWFSCEDCTCIALVEDGRAFVRTEAVD